MAAKESILARIRVIWSVVELLVEEAIIAAEGFVELKNGAERKAYVIDHVSKAIRRLEKRFDMLPTWAETFAFRSAEIALGWIVERVFKRLNAEGKVNVSA